jgi:hypothetical protein
MWLELGWGRDEPSGDSLDKGKHFVAGQKEQKTFFSLLSMQHNFISTNTARSREDHCTRKACQALGK